MNTTLPHFRINRRENDIITIPISDSQCIIERGGIEFSFKETKNENYTLYNLTVSNRTETDILPENIDFLPGIDTYMAEHPERNKILFPSMLRCEKTHFHGYFMSPDGKILAIASPDAIASYSLLYSKTRNFDENEGEYGHRIHTVALNLFHKNPLPERHPKNLDVLHSKETKEFNIYLIPLDDLSQYGEKISRICNIPIITADLFTGVPGNKITFEVSSKEPYTVNCKSPDNTDNPSMKMREVGVYTIYVTSESGKISEAKFYCRKPWSSYLKVARLSALNKPQKATTHAESWYGFFSAFLAAKHYPDKAIDERLSAQFEEISSLMFNFDKIEPYVIPERIQNTSTLISVLVDKYEADKTKNENDLKLASKFGDWLMKCQKEDGGYYKGNTLYTCVIYIAKSMFELAESEKAAGFEAEAKRHYESAARACEQLCEKLDDIQTEGEQTFEDGMISCSALQIAMYALSLPEIKRGKYIKAAEHMNKLHSCLEHKLVPDCRMNGASLRFWEAQYDIMFHKNFICSPHGWSAWTAYAKYYLYLLTGKEIYLKELFNCIGSCVQLMSEDGNLRWAFANDPYICGRKLVPDYEKPVTDGYSSVKLSVPACKGKYEVVTCGEEYIDMISDWYRVGEQRLTGGYDLCPLILADKTISVDPQGGACDNDVHEIFKCLEETVLKKAFIIEREDGTVSGYNCTASKINSSTIKVDLHEDTELLHTNLKNKYQVELGKKIFTVSPALKFETLTNK
ncbi:MAG: hypothetical protein E7441_05575 [Ruminococcaceae bacterium]|nr:hypothetical protein [Oscillospiraceae bacterium]